MRDRWRRALAASLVAVPLMVAAPPLPGGVELGAGAAAQPAPETFDLNFTVNVVPDGMTHSVTVTNLDDVTVAGTYGSGDTIELDGVPVGMYYVVLDEGDSPVSMSVSCDNVAVVEIEADLTYVVDASSPPASASCTLALEPDPEFEIPDGSFTLTETVVAPGSGAAAATFAVTGPDGTTASLGDGDSIATDLAAGSYTVAEVVPPGWVASLTCTITDLADDSQTVSGPGSVSFTVADGAAVVCSLVNTKLATVTIVNSAAPDESTSFPFDGPAGPFTLVDDGSRTFDSLSPGSIVVTRSPVTGWPLRSIVCVDDNGGATGAISVDRPIVTVDVIAGDAITCTFSTVKTDILTPAVEVATTTTVRTEIITPAVEVATTTTTGRPARTTSTTTTTTTTPTTTTTATTTSLPPEQSATVVEGEVLLSLGPVIQLGTLVVDVGGLCEGEDDPDPTLWVDGDEVPSVLDGDELRLDGVPEVVGEVTVAVRCGQGPIVAEGTALLGVATGGPGGSGATMVVVVFFFLAVAAAVIAPGLLAGAASPTEDVETGRRGG